MLPSLSRSSGILLLRNKKNAINASYDHISSAYSVDPAESKTMIYEQVGKNFPDAAPGELDAVLGWTR